MSKIKTKSLIDSRGIQYYICEYEEPKVNKYDLYDGGKQLDIEFDHGKNNTKVSSFVWCNGVPSFFRTIKIFKDEILGDSEIVNFTDDFFAE